MKKIVILYIPVLHRGYLEFLERHKDAEIIFILSEDLIKEFTFLEKEIRQIQPLTIRELIKSLGYNTILLTRIWIEKLQKQNFTIITANETISLKLIEKYFPNHLKKIDTIFLRWDEKNVYSQKDVKYDRVSNDKFDCHMMKLAKKESQKSSDWWRQVGAVLVIDKNNEKLAIQSHNQHIPSEHMPYALGDPRDVIPAGQNSELSSALHAEEVIFTECLQKGISLEGADLYVTVFPCPRCAKLITYSGIKRLFFSSGHASLDGLEILKSQNVEIILVK